MERTEKQVKNQKRGVETMGESDIKRLQAIIENADFSKGFSTTQELYKAGIKDSRELTSLCRAGVLVRHARGVYKKSESDKAHKMQLIANKIPEGVFGEATMLFLYKLIDKKPEAYSIAVPRSLSHHKRNSIDGIRISAYYADDERKLKIGVIKNKSPSVYVYDLERTICDCFARRNKLKKKLGDDFSLEDVSARYLAHKDHNIEKLMEYIDKLNLSAATRKEIEKYILSKT